uniref:Glycine-rich protein n=1 Tax=Globodera pallida TaxID=36090 RepID=A0A183BMM1_GLOPA
MSSTTALIMLLMLASAFVVQADVAGINRFKRSGYGYNDGSAAAAAAAAASNGGGYGGNAAAAAAAAAASGGGHGGYGGCSGGCGRK